MIQNTTSQYNLSIINPEITALIFSHLDQESLKKTPLVCKLFRDIVYSNLLLKNNGPLLANIAKNDARIEITKLNDTELQNIALLSSSILNNRSLAKSVKEKILDVDIKKRLYLIDIMSDLETNLKRAVDVFKKTQNQMPESNQINYLSKYIEEFCFNFEDQKLDLKKAIELIEALKKHFDQALWCDFSISSLKKASDLKDKFTQCKSIEEVIKLSKKEATEKNQEETLKIQGLLSYGLEQNVKGNYQETSKVLELLKKRYLEPQNLIFHSLYTKINLYADKREEEILEEIKKIERPSSQKFLKAYLKTVKVGNDLLQLRKEVKKLPEAFDKICMLTAFANRQAKRKK